MGGEGDTCSRNTTQILIFTQQLLCRWNVAIFLFWILSTHNNYYYAGEWTQRRRQQQQQQHDDE